MRSPSVAERIAQYEHKLLMMPSKVNNYDCSGSEVATAATATSASTFTSHTRLDKPKERNNSSSGECSHKGNDAPDKTTISNYNKAFTFLRSANKENSSGIHVSFSEGSDDSTASSSSNSPPNDRDVDVDDGTVDGDNLQGESEDQEKDESTSSRNPENALDVDVEDATFDGDDGTEQSESEDQEDDESTLYSSLPNSLDVDDAIVDGENDAEQCEPEDQEEEEETCSEAALMAAIAVATTKKGEESNYSDFFANAEAEAVAAAEHMTKEWDVSVGGEDEKGRAVQEDEIFQLIEQQISSHGERSTAGTKRSSAVLGADRSNAGLGLSGMLQDLERVLFFTDVIDRNPPPTSPSTSVSNSAIVSSGADPWLDSTMRKVGDTIYQSTVEVYNGVERTCKEVERTLFFTDVPDAPNVSPSSPRSAVIITDVSANDTGLFSDVSAIETFTTLNDTLNETVVSSGSGSDFTIAVRTSETTCTNSILTGPRRDGCSVECVASRDKYFDPRQQEGIAASDSSIFSDPQHDPHMMESLRPQSFGQRPMMPGDKPRFIRASQVALPPDELSRVFKSLEKNLLFTDLPPDEAGPSSPKASIPRDSAAPLCSSLGMCQTEVGRKLFFTDLDDKQMGEKSAESSQSLASQIFADVQVSAVESALQQQLLSRIEEVKELRDQTTCGGVGESGAHSSTVQVGAGSMGSSAVPADPFLNDVSENGTSIVTPPNPFSNQASKQSSNHGVLREKGVTNALSAQNAIDPKENETTPLRSSEQKAATTEEPGPKQKLLLLAHAKGRGQGYPVLPVINADSSAEKSVRLLVEVKVNKSGSESMSSGDLVGNEKRVSSASVACESKISEASGDWRSEDVQSRKKVEAHQSHASNEQVPTEKEQEKSEHQVQASSRMRSWISELEDGEKLSMMSEFPCSREETKRALSIILDKTDSDQEDGAQLGWKDCTSSLTDTYASVEDKGCGFASTKKDVGVSGVIKKGSSSQDTNVELGTETFDALLAEMQDLETAINLDLQRAHTVLRTTIEATSGQTTEA